MIQLTYGASLILSFIGIGIIDHKYRLAFFHDRNRTLKTIAVCIIFFLLWDALGIILGIFFHGQSIYDSNIMLAPDLPIEEVLFLSFLCYITLVLWRLIEKLWPRT